MMRRTELKNKIRRCDYTYVKLFFWTLSIVLNYKIIKQRFGSWILLPSSGKRRGTGGQKADLLGPLVELASALSRSEASSSFLSSFPPSFT
jgi:hypothetical protein